MTIGHSQVTDEIQWMNRTDRFSQAILHLHPTQMSATNVGTATMPGVTTMWLGSLGKLLWHGAQALGLADDGGSFRHSMTALTFAQGAVAFATAALIVLARAHRGALGRPRRG